MHTRCEHVLTSGMIRVESCFCDTTLVIAMVCCLILEVILSSDDVASFFSVDNGTFEDCSREGSCFVLYWMFDVGRMTVAFELETVHVLTCCTCFRP